MTREDVFLADILAHPADDDLRLVFADWLEEHGDAERAEFIRVQVWLSQAGKDPGSVARWREIERRHLLTNCVFYGIDLPMPAAPLNGSCTWRRGFVEEITCACAEWMEHGPAIVRQQPVMRVALTDKKPHCCLHPGSIFFRYYDAGAGVLGGADELPSQLWSVMHDGTSVWHLPTLAGINARLSEACLKLARNHT